MVKPLKHGDYYVAYLNIKVPTFYPYCMLLIISSDYEPTGPYNADEASFLWVET
jgi:hypothetical protein